MSNNKGTTTVVETTDNATTKAMNRTAEGIKQAANAAAASVETLARAGRVYLDGMQTIGAGIAQAAQKQVDETLETYRAIAGVKTVREGLALQTKLARAGATRFLTESATVAEQSAKLASDVIAPITERVRTAAQKLAA